MGREKKEKEEEGLLFCTSCSQVQGTSASSVVEGRRTGKVRPLPSGCLTQGQAQLCP